ALADALDAVVPKGRIAIGLDGGSDGRNRFELKWPNDVLASGAKLAGILLETAILEGDRFAVAVGIGVNVVAYPKDLPYPATSLSALGA
ncbi:MAG: biotin--[acetyl-CoA-carboxylase] ligase, partial [Mesorhizobium sp.]